MEGDKQKILVALSRKLEVAHQAYLKSLRGAQFEVVSCDDVDQFIALAQQETALFVIGTKTKFGELTGHELIRRLGELDPPPTAPALVLQDPSVSVSKLPETSIKVLQRWSQARESLGLAQSRSVAKAPPKIVHKQVKIQSTDKTLDMDLGTPKPSGSPLGSIGDGDLFDPGDISDFSPLTITKPTPPPASSQEKPAASIGDSGVIELTESDRVQPDTASSVVDADKTSLESPDDEGGQTEDLPFGIEPHETPDEDPEVQEAHDYPSSPREPLSEEALSEAVDPLTEAPSELPSYPPPSAGHVVTNEMAESQEDELNGADYVDATEDLEAPPQHVPEPRLPDKTEEVEPSFLFEELHSNKPASELASPSPLPKATPVPAPVQQSSSKRTTLKFAIIGIAGLIMAVTGFGIIYFTSENGGGNNQGGGTVVSPPVTSDGGAAVDASADGTIVASGEAGPMVLPSDAGESSVEEQPEELVLPIKFRRHSYDPYSVNRRKIRRIVEMIKSNPQVDFELIGYASTDESKTMSKILALRRAKRARDVLCMHGPSRTRFKTLSGGTSNPIIDDEGREFLEESRRVVIRKRGGGKLPERVDSNN